MFWQHQCWGCDLFLLKQILYCLANNLLSYFKQKFWDYGCFLSGWQRPPSPVVNPSVADIFVKPSPHEKREARQLNLGQRGYSCTLGWCGQWDGLDSVNAQTFGCWLWIKLRFDICLLSLRSCVCSDIFLLCYLLWDLKWLPDHAWLGMWSLAFTRQILCFFPCIYLTYLYLARCCCSEEKPYWCCWSWRSWQPAGIAWIDTNMRGIFLSFRYKKDLPACVLGGRWELMSTVMLPLLPLMIMFV